MSGSKEPDLASLVDLLAKIILQTTYDILDAAKAFEKLSKGHGALLHGLGIVMLTCCRMFESLPIDTPTEEDPNEKLN